MITSVNEILRRLEGTQISARDRVLKKWAISVIDECARNFEYEIYGEIYKNSIGLEHGETRPILVRESVLKVKEMIK